MKNQTEHEKRVEQLQEMQRIALSREEFLSRLVVIGDIVDELNQRVRAYLHFSPLNVFQAQDQALIDFQRYTHAAIVEIQDVNKDSTEFFQYSN